MNHYRPSVIDSIRGVYGTLTPSEKNIADFFVHNKKELDFSAKAIAERLFVSKAALSRFSKKCGFRGYREFIFNYTEEISSLAPGGDDQTALVINAYHELLQRCCQQVSEEQIQRVVDIMMKKNRVIFYGIGSSGLAANEAEMRFMRIGLDVDSITDPHMMRMNAVLVNENCLVIGISLSGKTTEVLQSLREASSHGAATILITSRVFEDNSICDEVLTIPVIAHLSRGTTISPQFPVLVVMDLCYQYYWKKDSFLREQLHQNTLEALQLEEESGE